MSKPTNWACWAWMEGDKIRYVGTGPFTDDGHPAVRRWASRFDDESPLSIWLQGYLEEPKRVVCGSTIMTKDMARDLAAIYRARNSKTLVSAREHSGGGHARRVAFVPTDDFTEARIYRSVREAGRDNGINPSTVTRRCGNEKCLEWMFIEDE